MDVKNTGTGGGRRVDVRHILQHSGIGCLSLRIIYVGGNPSNHNDYGGIPTQGGPLNDRESTLETKLWDLGVTPPS